MDDTESFNIFAPEEWEREFGPGRGTRVGARVGARELGASLYELDPGGQAAPYHLHHANEEMLIVLEGELELRTPQGRQKLGAGQVLSFPTGPEGAHRVRNVSATDRARYLVLSTAHFPEVAEYPDNGTILAMKAPGDGWTFPAGSQGEYMRQVREALQAEPEPEA